jgi:hypothetical protein
VRRSGQRLLAAIALALAVMCAVIVAIQGITPAGAHAVVRWTARTSLVLFALAYVARPLVQLRPTRTNREVLAHRKWIGLGFATSHGFHLVGILAIMWPDPAAFVRTQDPTIVIALAMYALLAAMAVTSIDRLRKKILPATWKRLHRTGMHLAWIIFATTYAAALAASWAYAIPVTLLLVIAAIRAGAWLRGRRYRLASQAAA